MERELQARRGPGPDPGGGGDHPLTGGVPQIRQGQAADDPGRALWRRCDHRYRSRPATALSLVTGRMSFDFARRDRLNDIRESYGYNVGCVVLWEIQCLDLER